MNEKAQNNMTHDLLTYWKPVTSGQIYSASTLPSFPPAHRSAAHAGQIVRLGSSRHVAPLLDPYWSDQRFCGRSEHKTTLLLSECVNGEQKALLREAKTIGK